MKLAEEAGKRDAFSKVALFNETLFDTGEEKGLNDLVGAVRLLIENIEHREVIDRHVNMGALKALACELIGLLWAKNLERKKKSAVNDVVRDVKSKLHLRSSSTQVKDVDLYKVMIEHQKVQKFNQIAKRLQTEKVIHEENIQGFKVVCKQRAFTGAGEIKGVSGRKVAFTDAYKVSVA